MNTIQSMHSAAALDGAPSLVSSAKPGSGGELMLYMHSFSGGGAERVMVQLANHWARTRGQTTLVVNVVEGPLARELAPEVELVSLDRHRGAAAFWPLVRLMRRRRPRAILSAMTPQNVIASAARRISGAPSRLVVTEHTSLAAPNAFWRTIRGRLILAAVPMSYPFADAVAAVSTNSARDLDRRLNRPPGSTAVVHNPVWPPLVTPNLAPGDVHPWLAGPEPVLLSAGRLTTQKNHLNLVEAVAIVRRTRPVRAIIIGEGELRPAIEARIAELSLQEVVDLPGFKRNVGDFLAATGLFVLSSDSEGLPLVLLEAMYMGTPIVSTDCESGPAELLDNGAYGALVPIDDPAALARSILAALDEPPDRERLRARAREFSIEAIAQRYERLLF